MKNGILLLCFLFPFLLFSQNPCDISTNVSDTIGTYKSTKEYLVFERNFAGTSSFMHFSLELTDGIPMLNLQYIQKSKEFIRANCLDKNSRIYLQLNNGKIVTLIYSGIDNCGTTVRDDKGFANRIMQGNFLFMKSTIDALKTSPVSLMRIKFATETVDYIFRTEIKAEFDGKTYQPEKYFQSALPCILN